MNQIKTKSALFIIVILLPLILGCSFPARLWWLIQQATKSMNKGEKLVEMTAKGNIIGPNPGMEWVNFTLRNSEITLHWYVDESDGTTLPTVWGEGFSVLYSETGCPNNSPDTVTNQLTFTGTFNAEKLQYEGGVAVKAADTCSNKTTMPEYSALWKATRSGDLIEGEIDRMGVFRLVVQPAPQE